MAELTIKPHAPLDMVALASLFNNAEDLRSANPYANWPFNKTEWEELLSPDGGDAPYFICCKSKITGHFSLRTGDVTAQRYLAFLFLSEKFLGGQGERIMQMVEHTAKDDHGAVFLTLRVNRWNERALHLYQKCGYHTIKENADNILMRKDLL